MTTKKHILLYNSNEPLPQQGGMERVTDLLAKALLNVGYEVTLLCKYSYRLGKTYNAPTDILYLPGNKDNRRFLETLVIERNIYCIIDQTEGDIVGRFGIFRHREDFKSKVKLIAVQHNSTRAILDNYNLAFAKDFTQTRWGTLKQFFYDNVFLKLKYYHSVCLTKRLYRDLNTNYDRIVTLSSSFIEDFCFYCPKADRIKLFTIPNFNTFESCELTTAQKHVLFVGRLRNCVKGVNKLLRIWNKVESSFADWQLDIVGDGEDRDVLEMQAQDLGLEHVTFHGFQNPAPFYQRSRIFCMTSIYEGFGMVLTEAMQHGVVPMAFNSYGSVTDIIDDDINGFLVKPFDEKEYADKLVVLMSNEDKYTKMSRAAMTKSVTFSKEIIVEKWCNLVENL